MIRVLLLGAPRMLRDIVEHAIAAEPDMISVEGAPLAAADLTAFLRARRVDVAIFPAAVEGLGDDRIVALLRAHPRLGMLALDGSADQGTLHHLVPVHETIGRLTRSSVIAAIRAGAALRRH